MKGIVFESETYCDVEEIKKIMVENEDRETIEEISDDDAYEYAGQLEYWEWEDVLNSIEDLDSPVVVTGYFMSWMGPQQGGKVYPNLKSAMSNIIMDDSHIIYSITDDGMLVLNETHHDAPVSGNHYEFKVLTKSGQTWYENHKDEDKKTVCETLFNTSRYSKNVDSKVWGI